MNIADTALVGVRSTPHVIAGRLSPDDQRAVFEWVSLNTAALVAYWEGRIDTIELGQQLQRLPLRQPSAPPPAPNAPGLDRRLSGAAPPRRRSLSDHAGSAREWSRCFRM